MNQETYRFNTADQNKWSALDPSSEHPCNINNEEIVQEATQAADNLQFNEELIFIKDSCDVTVTTTDTKAALNLQAALQAAIAVVVSISIADSSQAQRVTQELLQASRNRQISRQKTVIENSRNVNVTTTDTQVAVNVQLLLQVLLALLVEVNIL
ncbi:spore coat protein [Bacillus sp. HNG]|uniref:spore coat protein n=1 Tax=Bacillaceae TaxID=186817 RepID=UPI000E2F80BF|nr:MULTISPECIES: spore coat protein [Bacillaceae]MDR4886046.1 spore coat protein [Fredinandcohnia sp. QZ13]RFB18700.1 spore coat protein [Bacillus sp. HNG]